VAGRMDTDGRRIVARANTRSRSAAPAMTSVGARTARGDAVTIDEASASPRQTSKPNVACFWCIGQVASFLQQTGCVELLPHGGVVPAIAPMVRSAQSTAALRRCITLRIVGHLMFTRMRGEKRFSSASPRLRVIKKG
jgi:hypothetical protein